MKFALISDLHLNHYPDLSDGIPPAMENTCLIVAGDVCDGYQTLCRGRADDDCSPLDILYARFDWVVLVPGNHDHLDAHLGEWSYHVRKTLRESGIDNIHVLDNDTVTIEGVKIVGSTLWTNTDANPVWQFRAERTMIEYLYGYNRDGERLRTKDIANEWRKNIGYFWAAGGRDYEEQPLVWVSHHAMFERSISSRFAGNTLNFCYAHDTDEAFEVQAKHKPDFILHGHTHARFYYEENGSRVICNPYGYPQETETVPQPVIFLEN